MSKTLKISFLGFFFLLPLFTFGQSIDSYNDSLKVVVTPPNPQPNQIIKIRVESSLVDLSSSLITWNVDGKNVAKGKDRREVQITLKEVGKETVVIIDIDSPSSGLLQKEITINPTAVDLIYEANTYTPPFFKGKALPSAESVITLLALPKFIKQSGSFVSSKDLIFTWKKDGVVDGAKSGLGKDTYTFLTGRLPEDTPLIEVAVLYAEENIKGYASFLAPTIEPQVLVYENNPILGTLLNKALGTENLLAGKEMGLVAYPYFFSGKNREGGSFEYSWSINSAKVDNGAKNKSTLTIRSPGGEGSSFISVSLINTSKIFQTGRSNFMIKYKE